MFNFPAIYIEYRIFFAAFEMKWSVHTMVLTLEGNLKQAAHVRGIFLKSDFQFATAVALNNCLKQIKLPIKLYTCSPYLSYHLM